MKRYKVVVEAKSPLLLGDRFAKDNIKTSRPFIAGSVLRGALAGAVLKPMGLWRHGGPRKYIGRPDFDRELPEGFKRIFLEEGRPRFGFLYPVRENGEEARRYESYPIPLSARSCKVKGGFQADGGHGVVDVFAESLRRQAGQKAHNPPKCIEKSCGGRIERLRGFCSWKEDDPNSFKRASVNPRSFVRVGLNRRLETAEEGILYTLEALTPGTGVDGSEPPLSFVGYLRMTEAQREVLVNLLSEQVPMEDGRFRTRIGSDRARGMGDVEVWISDKPEKEDEITGRLEDLQRIIDDREPNSDSFFFSLTLRSPLLIYDDRGLPAQTVTSELLSGYGLNGRDVEVLYGATFAEQGELTGWSAAWGLPKPAVSAIASGSVLSFRTQKKNRSSVEQFLRKAALEGLGEDRHAGLGEVVPCDAFHILFDNGGD